jgi:energy-coupling factor transport system ATP-binding protein
VSGSAAGSGAAAAAGSGPAAVAAGAASGGGAAQAAGSGPAAPTPGPAVYLDGVSVRYPGRREPALTVSLQVEPGELLGVAGRTGAGKSTLALLAGGFIPRVVHARVCGTARIDGLDALTAHGSELAGRVGIVFSTPANQLSASKLTVREELAFGLENLAVPRHEMDPRIDEIMDRLAIAHLAERDPFTLSGGEQQRVAIASVLVMGTSVLVLDEPVAQLDPAGSSSVATLLRRLAGEGRSIICAEHDPSVLSLADRCLVLESGRAAALGLPGSALSTATLAPRGFTPPTIVTLAEMAGLPPDRAFDEEAVAAALGALRNARGSRTQSSAPAYPKPPASADWSPLRKEPTPPIIARGLTHHYPGGPEVLRGVDLEIRPGEAVAIVGQNGSGKTTLVKHLNGLLRPDAGSVEIDGRDIHATAVSSIARTVGFVFQNPDDQLFNRSVEREVGFGAHNIGLDGRLARELVDRALELTGLSSVREVNPYDLGLSTRKLVALASVLAMEPAVLVLDEPTTGQDGPGVARVGSIVDAYRRAGRTVIAITHDMEFAAAHFGRVIVMRTGEVVADGTPADVLSVANVDLLASTGLEPPVATRIGARLGLAGIATLEALVSVLGLEGAPPLLRTG